MTSARTIRVASVPADHVYVRHLSALQGPDLVHRLTDPPVPGRQQASQWWPPVMLEPGWVREHQDEFDVFHLHFGFDAKSPEQLLELTRELREAGKPFVYTVHDLRNPHHSAADLHLAQLDVLIPAADAVITLTPGAAAFINRRWHRQPLVLPHPHVVELDRLASAQRGSTVRSAPFVVGLHAKSLRASMDPLAVLKVLVDAISRLPDCVLTVNVHGEVMQESSSRYDQQLFDFLRRADTAGDLSLTVHDYLDDEALWAYLSGLDVSVLPYKFGTHSGWLEACYDLGTTVLAPTCGFYSEQHPCLSYRHDETGLDADSLRSAVFDAYENRPLWQADPDARQVEREALAEAHLRLYSELLTSSLAAA
jgi:hypothetical protein